jgi:hypothetical protein
MPDIIGGWEPRSPLLQNRAGQPPCHEGAGIDVNPVRPDVGPLGRGVAVHHDLAEVGAAGEELFSNPEILLALATQRHAGADTGMAMKYLPIANDIDSDLRNSR